MMSLWDALRMNMMISYQELVRTFPKAGIEFRNLDETAVLIALANKGFTFADYGTLALRTS